MAGRATVRLGAPRHAAAVTGFIGAARAVRCIAGAICSEMEQPTV